MTDSFTLNFFYKGIPREVSCVLRVSAYTYQFLCDLEKNELVVEKDDEGNLRVIKANPFSEDHLKTDPGLVKAFLSEMEKILQ